MTTIKNLLLALLNATLILVALCLVLALLLTQSAERAADGFRDAVGSMAPLRAEVAEVKEAMTGLRTEVRLLAEQPGALSENAETALEARLSALNDRMAQMDARFAGLDEVPNQVIETAVDHAADRAADLINQYRSCTPGDPT